MSESYYQVASHIGIGYEGLLEETIISEAELRRFGVTYERIQTFVSSTPPVLRQATPSQVDHAKHVVGITPENDAANREQIETLTAAQVRAHEAVQGDPLKTAHLLFQTLKDWRAAEREYLSVALKNAGESYPGKPGWYAMTARGFAADIRRARLSTISQQIVRILPDIKAIVAKLPQIEATNFQIFEETLSEPPIAENSAFDPAKRLAEMLTHKIPVNMERERKADEPKHQITLIGQGNRVTYGTDQSTNTFTTNNQSPTEAFEIIKKMIDEHARNADEVRKIQESLSALKEATTAKDKTTATERLFAFASDAATVWPYVAPFLLPVMMTIQQLSR